MQPSLFPYNIVNHTSEQILSRDSSRGHIIYCAVVLAVIIALGLLPILKVTVSIQSNGIIRPTAEKNEIKSIVSGRISKIFIKENQKIEKDRTILVLEDSVLKEKLRFVVYEENEKKDFIHDLRLLTAINSDINIDINLFKTMHYKSEYLYFKSQLDENRYNQEKARKESERYRYLHKNKLTSLSELEYKELEFSRLKIQHDMLIDQHSAEWHKELLVNHLKLKELNASRQGIEREKNNCTISSPITGTVEEFSGISTGSYIQAGQLIAVISPDKDLIAELYVSPRDIGLLRVKTKANIQIDTFDYNRWGLISGFVKEISGDFIPMDNQPFFRVRCNLNQNFLELKNGYKGYLKKGMTIRARFLITERSLFQLLYDKVDDWLNPFQKRS
ncbi:membrane fusion protein, peptide pheromone/bacteriocin exporter [Candidatus Magnetomoraceae bacterium gMMP-15]